jgi:hypothetical protein
LISAFLDLSCAFCFLVLVWKFFLKFPRAVCFSVNFLLFLVLVEIKSHQSQFFNFFFPAGLVTSYFRFGLLEVFELLLFKFIIPCYRILFHKKSFHILLTRMLKTLVLDGLSASFFFFTKMCLNSGLFSVNDLLRSLLFPQLLLLELIYFISYQVSIETLWKVENWYPLTDRQRVRRLW